MVTDCIGVWNGKIRRRIRMNDTNEFSILTYLMVTNFMEDGKKMRSCHHLGRRSFCHWLVALLLMGTYLGLDGE